MIRTASTLSISSHDMQNYSYLVNGTQLGLLSTASQNIHIQSSHRAFQYIAALRADKEDLAAGLARQRQLISRFLTVTNILSQRGAGELNSLLREYSLLPDLMLCYDENRLQAWLPATVGFYLLRNGELRRVKPAALQDDYFCESYLEDHYYYSLQIQADDHYLLLPPQLVAYFPAGEIAGKLLDIRQLPAKMSEIIRIARNKGYSADESWLAIEVQLKEDDDYPDPQRRGRSWLAGRGADSQSDLESGSESLEEAEPVAEKTELSWFDQLLQDKRKLGLALAGLVVLLVLLISALVWSAGNKEKEIEPSVTDPDLTTTTQAPATPTPTKKPTSTPVPTKPPVLLVVAANRLNLRDIPDREGKLLTVLENGEELIQLEDPADGWVKVETSSGLAGFVFYDYVAESEEGQR